MTPTLAEITKELLKTYNRHPRKRLGQHFLIDPKVLQRIIDAAELSAKDVVIEIGTGLGVLTAELAKRAKRVITIEIDKDLLQIAKEVLKEYYNVTMVHGDFLKTKFTDLGSKSLKVVANLPYYITAPIIERILETKDKFKLAVLTVQKEVAERMVASPGSKKYGSFSVFVQYHAEVKLNSLISKSSFYPWPEVSSAIVVLRPYQTPKYEVKNEKLFFDLVHKAFQQRRKMLRNSLKEYNLEGCGIDLNQRPEMLSIEDFVRLSGYRGIRD